MAKCYNCEQFPKLMSPLVATYKEIEDIKIICTACAYTKKISFYTRNLTTGRDKCAHVFDCGCIVLTEQIQKQQLKQIRIITHCIYTLEDEKNTHFTIDLLEFINIGNHNGEIENSSDRHRLKSIIDAARMDYNALLKECRSGILKVYK